MWARNDSERYRKRYPGWAKKDRKNLRKNIDFYEGKIASRPRGDFIKEIHNTWWGDYNRLEAHHGYIQWIFPIREEGLNYQAQRLQLHEAKHIQGNEELKARVVQSYEMMLDFYGMKLVDRGTGKLKRARNYKRRYHHLNNSFHNYLRITRMLKCLGELDLEHLKAPFLRHVIKEVENRLLTNCSRSLQNYWIPVLRDDAGRDELFALFKDASRTASSSRWNLRDRGKKRVRYGPTSSGRHVVSSESESDGDTEKDESPDQEDKEAEMAPVNAHADRESDIAETQGETKASDVQGETEVSDVEEATPHTPGSNSVENGVKSGEILSGKTESSGVLEKTTSDMMNDVD